MTMARNGFRNECQYWTQRSHFVKKWFLGRTPRQAYSVTFLMPKVRSSFGDTAVSVAELVSFQANFGTVLPSLSLLATIAFAYSVLSPVINGLAMLAFILFFFSWKFRMLISSVSSWLLVLTCATGSPNVGV